VRIGYVDEVVEACKVLWGHGILITPALFPAVPLDGGGLRFTVTAANTEGQVRLALEALRMVREGAMPERSTYKSDRHNGRLLGDRPRGGRGVR
jgi:hypothetical protein